MSQLLPNQTTVGDLCTAALQECGRVGIGQSALPDDINKAWARLQWMLQEWERKRWLVYHLRTYSVVATGQQSYTFGPGGEINTNSVQSWGLATLKSSGGTGYNAGDFIDLAATPPSGSGGFLGTVQVASPNPPGGPAVAVKVTGPGIYTSPLPTAFTQATTSGAGTGATFNTPTWTLLPGQVTAASSTSARPAKLESAFLRQIQNSEPNQVDYPLTILQSMEDYNKIALKSLMSFPGAVFMDSQWPLAQVYCYPVPQASIYQIFLSVTEQLPTNWLTLASVVSLPYEYFSAILYNLALRLRPVYQISTYPGDPLEALAKNALNTLRGANTQIARLGMPAQLTRPGIYNVFSDQNY